MLSYLRMRFELPIMQGLPFGHMKDKLTLPVGARCALDSSDHGFTMTMQSYPSQSAK
jgi:muramoyltetrapeptide carboxypeptidase